MGMVIIFVSDAAWTSMQATITRIETKIDALTVAVKALGHLTPAQQATLNKIFDTATADSAKMDVALSALKDQPHG
jgi:hypothetical protein